MVSFACYWALPMAAAISSGVSGASFAGTGFDPVNPTTAKINIVPNLKLAMTVVSDVSSAWDPYAQ